MEKTTGIIADWVAGLSHGDISPATVHEIKRRLVDSLGCAVGALDSPPYKIARSLASDVTGTLSATAFGLPKPTTVEMATFVNTVLVRYLDYNDMYFAPVGGGCHPSDILPTVLAMGQALGSSGRDVLLATVVAYEVNGALAGTVRLRERGWDQGLTGVAAAAMAAGKLLGLSREQLGHAVSLAVTPHIPTRQTRAGELSMWKGCATAGAARNGVFSALLASRGMTGPPEPFEGMDGLWQRVTGPFELRLPVRSDSYVIENIHTKFRPTEYNSQGALDLIIEMRGLVSLDEIERIDMETYWLAYSEIGSEPAKWDPQTRETADHSLPYLLGRALIDGDVGLRSFTQDLVLDPKLRPLMSKIHITENKDYSQRFPAELLHKISIRSTSGQTYTREIAHPRGHALKPLSDAEMDLKFDNLVALRGEHDAAICRELRDKLWQIETVPNIAPLIEPLGGLHVE